MSNSEQAHLPTFGVSISNEAIRAICSTVCPAQTLDAISELPPGESFNNRIYFIRYAYSSVSHEEHVLKLSGRFWGPEKIENEVACLLLLEAYCPDLPTPRVIAYFHGDGPIRVVVRNESNNGPLRTEQADQATAHGESHPWLLTTRCPGERLDIADLEGPHGTDILAQLARCMAQWRQQMPHVRAFGNVRLLSTHHGHVAAFSSVPTAQVCGLLQSRSHKTTSIPSTKEYFNLCISDQLERRANNSIFTTGEHNETASLVEELIHDILPNLRLFKRMPQRPVFTHNDLSPRNILISKYDETSAPAITGIVDFEFAGFFPYEEDFTNNAVHGRDDWPISSDSPFMAALEEHGVLTPLFGMDAEAWNEAETLVTMIANIAPWWLAEGDIIGDELTEELRKASEIVKKSVGTLRAGLENKTN